jgi:hypothetical protein
MDKYIKKEDLGEAIMKVAEAAIKNADKVRTELEFVKWGDDVEMRVKVIDRVTFASLAKQDYVIVMDVVAEDVANIVAAAVAAKEKADAEAAKEQEVEPNNEEE